MIVYTSERKTWAFFPRETTCTVCIPFTRAFRTVFY